jgi:hypothetical protein
MVGASADHRWRLEPWDAMNALFAILRDARKSGLLRMRSEIYPDRAIAPSIMVTALARP